MVANYFRSLLRNIVRNKFYTLFNILGLAIGLTAALFILFYISDELSYDRHYENYDRIYRLESTFIVNGNPDRYATFPVPLGPAMKREIPEIEEMTRLHFMNEELFSYGEKKFFEESFAFADSSYFLVFSNPFLQGNPTTCLREPNSIVLTESTALRYFGEEDPMGRVLIRGNQEGYRVTGVIRDLPASTHLKFDALASMSTRPGDYTITKPSRYWRVILYTYVLLHKDASIQDVYDKFMDFYIREMEPLGKKFNVRFEIMSTPLKDTHFRQGLISEQPSGNKAYLVIFGAIAAFILIIAAINYMNMATARSASRAKEVGIRKVLGADKKELIKQFIGESMGLSFIAMVLALILVAVLMGSFNDFTGKEIKIDPAGNALVFGGIVLLTFIIGLFSGSYPAFYLSSFQPAVVLKGPLSSTGRGNRNLRRILVAVQFFIAVFMVISSMVVSGQLHFLKTKNLGFDPENLILIQIGDPVFQERTEAFRNELLQNPSIVAVTNSSGVPGILRWIKSMKIEQEEGMTERSILYMETDYDFCSTYEIEIIQGRDFNREMGTDSLEAVLINETAAMEFGWSHEPLGKRIHYGYAQDGSGGRMLKVIGVVRDFHFRSLHNAIEPLLLFIEESPGDLLSIRLQSNNRERTLQSIEEKWQQFGAAFPFHYEFMSERLSDSYTADEKTAAIIRTGTIFTILLALLGLLGLSSFVAEQKTKEIGIRKIHGASVWNILMHLYSDFVGLFALAFLVAVPFAWWRLNEWLDSEFVYHIEVNWDIFVLAGIFCMFIGIATISYFIVRAALGNPVKAIKYE